MPQPYQISIDQLRVEGIKKFALILAPDFFEVEEPDLRFREEVSLAGEAYLVEGNLVVHFDANTRAEMPCAICNQKTSVLLAVKGVYHTVSLEKFPDALFDLRPVVREELLIELPKTAECLGKCPERGSVAQFMREEDEKKSPPSNYFPFSELK